MCKNENNCCGAQQTPTATIDWMKPIEQYSSTKGTANPLPVRVLAHGIITRRHPGFTTLVSITGASGTDVLVLVNPNTGGGHSVRHGIRFCFRNVQPKPVVITDVTYLNYYHNGSRANVIEGYDSRAEADAQNCFQSRDCCVKLSLKQTGGVWSVSATLEAQ